MAAASPPILPTAAPSPIPTTADTDANPAAARAFLSRLLDSAKRALSGARPWAELADRSALSRPDTLSDATSRLRKNLAYFRVNYAAVVAFSLAAALLAHPFSLAALLALLAAWCLLYILRHADAPPSAAPSPTGRCSGASSPAPPSSSSSPPSAPSSSPRSPSAPPSSARTAPSASRRTSSSTSPTRPTPAAPTRCSRSSPTPQEEDASEL